MTIKLLVVHLELGKRLHKLLYLLFGIQVNPLVYCKHYSSHMLIVEDRILNAFLYCHMLRQFSEILKSTVKPHNGAYLRVF